MIQYGSDQITELVFTSFSSRIERRDDQWIDIELVPQLSSSTPVPAEIAELTILVICTLEGIIAQIVPLDEGCDCEFQFTAGEKEQIQACIMGQEIQAAIANLVSLS